MNKKWVIVENAAMAFKAATTQAKRARHSYGRPAYPRCQSITSSSAKSITGTIINSYK